jgi:hypothetical protein
MRVFSNYLLQKIKDKMQLWISAGAKHLARHVQHFWPHTCLCFCVRPVVSFLCTLFIWTFFFFNITDNSSVGLV